MNTEATQAVSTTRLTHANTADLVKEKRESYHSDNSSEEATSSAKSAIQPEELLSNIKALTEDGLYSVRFEMHKDTQDLIINLVDSQSGDVIRQIPPKEIVQLHEYMNDLRGNIVNTES
jgi:flagellar protein FlaG